MKRLLSLLSLWFCCSIILVSCYKEQLINDQANVYESTTFPPMQSEPAPHHREQIPTPPVAVSEISFYLADLDSYLVFDNDGLTIPEIKAFFEEDFVEYERHRLNQERYWPEFYLDLAEYDLNDDGKTDYIIKHPDSERSGGNYFNEGFMDIVYQYDGDLKRMYTNRLANVECPVAILSTVTNGFHDIAINHYSHYKPIYRYNGNSYEYSTFPYEEKVSFDRISSSSAYENFELKDNTIMLRYDFRMFDDYSGEDYRFFIAGLFITAEQNGITKNDRLWACEENGVPKLFSGKELWLQVLFCDDYGGADLSLYSDDLIWPDEAVIIIYKT